MIDAELLSTIIGAFVGVGVLVAGSGFAYSQVKLGGSRAKDDLIQTLKDTADAERTERERLSKEKSEMLISHQAQITELHKELGELRGRLLEQAQKTEEYRRIATARDPELQNTLNEIKDYLKTLVGQSRTNEVRNEKIDKDTKHETGKVLRQKV